MPVKKKADASSEEAPKKKPRKKKVSVAAKVAKEPEPIVETKKEEARPVSTTPKARRQRNSGGGKLLLLVVLLIVVSGSVYAVQKKQTDEVSSKLSELENRLQGKFGELEQGIDKVKQEAEKGTEDAVKKATTKQFVSSVFSYTLIYPRTYSVVYLNTEPANTDLEPDETVVLMRDIDAVQYEDSFEGGPHITFASYKKTADIPLIDWLMERSGFTNVTEETELEEVEFSGKKGYAYSWTGLGMADAVAIDAGDYILTASAVRFEKNDTVLRDDLLEILASISF